jgi:hypothetical protein
MARPRWHALITAPLAWHAARSWGAASVAGAVAGGLLIDVDHLVDYGWTRLSGKRTHFFAPLHGWELSLALAGAAWWLQREADEAQARPDSWTPHLTIVGNVLGPRWERRFAAFLGGLAAGSTLHLVQDIISNRPAHPGTYSLLFRIWRRFDRHGVGWGEHPDFHGWSGLPWYRWF